MQHATLSDRSIATMKFGFATGPRVLYCMRNRIFEPKSNMPFGLPCSSRISQLVILIGHCSGGWSSQPLVLRRQSSL